MVQQIEETLESAPPTPTAVPPTTVETVPLADVVAQITRDCRREPAIYLTETAQPYGGE